MTSNKNNQCDGCLAGIPVDSDGKHRTGREGYYFSRESCTAHLYQRERCDCNTDCLAATGHLNFNNHTCSKGLTK
jgi:hypothetical protein